MKSGRAGQWAAGRSLENEHVYVTVIINEPLKDGYDR